RVTDTHIRWQGDQGGTVVHRIDRTQVIGLQLEKIALENRYPVRLPALAATPRTNLRGFAKLLEHALDRQLAQFDTDDPVLKTAQVADIQRAPAQGQEQRSPLLQPQLGKKLLQ